MNKKIISYRQKLLGVAAIFLVFVALGIDKIKTYTADPIGEKECPPIDPTLGRSSFPESLLKKISAHLPWLQKGGTINDASCLDKTAVYGVVAVTEVKDIAEAFAYARENSLKVSLSGVRHSMGGQAFAKDALVLDMRPYKQIALNESEKTVTVQSGATWHDIQNIIHPRYAVKAMQSTDIFTVGGSISVNAHGMDHRAGSVGDTIRSMRVMLPDGSIVRTSRDERPDLFRHVVGGYGLFGAVLDVTLDVVDNEIYDRKRSIIDYKEFPTVFESDIKNDEKLGLFYAHLSTSPGSFLKEMMLYTYRDSEATDATVAPLTEVENVKLRRFVLELAKRGSLMARLKWFAEKYIEPRFEGCEVSRNQAMKEGEACLVSRNEPMHDSVKYLKNAIPDETDILHEYFIPRDQFVAYVDGMREVLQKNHAVLLNASVRVVHAEDIALNYAPQDAFAIVLYLHQDTDPAGNAAMKKVTQELIDLTNAHGGRFFLPYQLYYDKAQLAASYPEIADVARAKKRYDPSGLLTSTFYETYWK
jgi:FAD/FMN-containing dehydrogenase